MKTKTNLLAAVCLAFCCLTANARQVNCGSHSHSKDENTCHLSSAVEQERVRLRDSILTNSRVSGGSFTLPSLGTVLDSLPSHGSSHLTLLFISLYSLLT